MLNEFFNELAYNPGPKKAGFLFFLDWGNHDLNSVVSSADANGPLGRSLVYFNCEVLPILKGVAEVNPTVKLLVGLLRPPTKAECQEQGLIGAGATKASAASASAAYGTPPPAPPPPVRRVSFPTHNTSFSQLTPVKAGSSSTATRAARRSGGTAARRRRLALARRARVPAQQDGQRQRERRG